MVMTGFFEILLFILLTGGGGQAGLPLGMPPGPEDANVLNFAPDDCLFYSNWSPIVAPDSSNNPTEKWLAQPEILQAIQKLRKGLNETTTDKYGKVALGVAENMICNGGGFYIRDVEFVRNGLNLRGGLLSPLGAEVNSYVQRMAEFVKDDEFEMFSGIKEVSIEGAKFFEATSQTPNEAPICFGVVNDTYFALTIGQGEMARLLANLKTDQPEWLTQLRGDSEVKRVSSVTYLNLPPLLNEFISSVEDEVGPDFSIQPVIEALGFDKVKTCGWVSGLDSEGFICRGRINLDGEPTGVFDLFDDEPITPEDLARISDDRMAVLATTLSAEKIAALISDLFDTQPMTRGFWESGVDQFNAELGIDVESEILEKLMGPVYVYGKVNITNPTAGWVLSVQLSEDDEVNATYEKIIDFVKENADNYDYLSISEKEVQGVTVYTQENERGWGEPNFSWTLANGELVLSLDKGSVRKHLRREEMEMDSLVRNDWFSKVFETQRMDSEGPYLLSSLNVGDAINLGLPLAILADGGTMERLMGFSTKDIPSSKVLTAEMQPNLMSMFRTPDGFEMVQRQTYPGGTPGTFASGVAIGALGASAPMRKAAAKTTSLNNMRQIALAIHNYADVHRALPARYSKNDEDKKLLSWRVHILPYIEQQALYEEFRLDEPWDSEHNKALLEKMPAVFKHPKMKLEAGKTAYVVAAGDKTAISEPTEAKPNGPTGVQFRDITDGTSLTALTFEVNAEASVYWTKPDDLNYAQDDAFEKLFAGWENGEINVGLCDGSVGSFSRERIKEIFKKMIQVDDGEVVELWDR